jgi:transcriptional regulator with XRE-family HTH domain
VSETPDEPQPRAELIALGRTVRRHREARSWTLDTLAAESGVSRRTVINVEAGAHSVGIENLFDLAQALGTKLAVLITEAEVDGESGPDL